MKTSGMYSAKVAPAAGKAHAHSRRSKQDHAADAPGEALALRLWRFQVSSVRYVSADQTWSLKLEGEQILMEFRKLGGSDLNASVLGLGGNTFGPPRIDETETAKVIHFAQDLGINFVDTAIGYGEGESEKYLGTALAGRRDKWIVATKFTLRRMEDATAWDRIHEHCETSLGKLGTDYIDLYQLHQPNKDVPEDEILRALDDLVKSGKVREVGSCNYQSWQMAENRHTAASLGVKAFISAQNHYNLLRRNIEAELDPYCSQFGASLVPYFPLAGGFLTGKYKKDRPAPEGTRGAEGSGIIKRNTNDRNFDILPSLEAFAEERGHTVAELAIAWLMANPNVGSVITGVSNTEQVMMNAKAAEWQLSEDEKAQVDKLAPREGDDEGQAVGARAATGA